eukprot:6450792-Prorocentrum_lima.AAC.1
MTSSLVGSEMCIRDRTVAPLKLFSQGSQVGALPPIKDKPATAGLDWDSPCLLYTSDGCRRYA